MKRKRIILAVTNDLVTDQRVHRSCMALHEAGYEVALVGRRLPDSVPVNRPYKTVRMPLIFRKKAIFYAEFNLRLFFRLIFSRAEAFYANDTDTLLAVYCAARLRRKPFFFDAHEMFPEVPELVGRDRVKAFWTKIEDLVMPRIATYRFGAAACTVCRSIADIYKDRYGVDMAVVRNVPLRREPQHAERVGEKRILLYQGAVNVGRGVEWIVEAMPYLDNCEFVVAGNGDIFNEIRALVRERGLEDRVRLLGRLPLDELSQWTCRADLGMSLLENRGLNYYYSFPNRIADFVQSGVPVLATDFPEIHRIVERYQIGTLVPDGDHEPRRLAATIRQALDYWDSVDPEERLCRFALAAKELSWENDKNVLLSQVDTIFRSKRR